MYNYEGFGTGALGKVNEGCVRLGQEALQLMQNGAELSRLNPQELRGMKGADSSGVLGSIEITGDDGKPLVKAGDFCTGEKDKVQAKSDDTKNSDQPKEHTEYDPKTGQRTSRDVQRKDGSTDHWTFDPKTRFPLTKDVTNADKSTEHWEYDPTSGALKSKDKVRKDGTEHLEYDLRTGKVKSGSKDTVRPDGKKVHQEWNPETEDWK